MKIIGLFYLAVIILPFSFLLGVLTACSPFVVAFLVAAALWYWLKRKCWRLTLSRRLR